MQEGVRCPRLACPRQALRAGPGRAAQPRDSRGAPGHRGEDRRPHSGLPAEDGLPGGEVLVLGRSLQPFGVVQNHQGRAEALDTERPRRRESDDSPGQAGVGVLRGLQQLPLRRGVLQGRDDGARGLGEERHPPGWQRPVHGGRHGLHEPCPGEAPGLAHGARLEVLQRPGGLVRRLGVHPRRAGLLLRERHRLLRRRHGPPEPRELSQHRVHDDALDAVRPDHGGGPDGHGGGVRQVRRRACRAPRTRARPVVGFGAPMTPGPPFTQN
mmetsp:Transcript_43668/g.123622  ORF Transcript_43668/g.123622 Transcript_43668/m.123622 type:complete len:269 (-) Transcript_43668:29-835(-)